MIQIKNYSFKKHATSGKYRILIESFIDSNEKLIAWKCNDIDEFKRVYAGFSNTILKRNIKSLIRVKQCKKDLVVGLERIHEK